MIAFHAQQTIEKSYKAILVSHDENPPRVHDLSRLAALAGKYLEDPTFHADRLDRISQYYIQSRYPLMLEADDSPEPSGEELEEMVSHAKKVLAFAKDSVG